MIPQERRDSRSDRLQNNRPRRDFSGQSASANSQAVNVVFRKPVQKVLEKVRNEPFFKWPNKMVGDPINRNQNLYCHYHQDHGHTTEDRRNLWDHLEQLVREGGVKASIAPFQWPKRPDWFGVSGKSSIEASSWYHKCHICCPREDWILPFQDNVSIPLFR